MNKKEKLVYFDVETTGLPTHRNLIPTMLDKQPHIVQMSWIIVETIHPTYKKLPSEILNSDSTNEIKTEINFDESSKAWEDDVGYYEEVEEEKKEEKGAGRMLMHLVETIAYNSKEYKAVKLAALTYVIKYYYKLGYRFANSPNTMFEKNIADESIFKKINQVVENLPVIKNDEESFKRKCSRMECISS